MLYLVTQKAKHKYNHLRSIAAIVQANSAAGAIREAKAQSSDFEPCDTHTATKAEPYTIGLPFYI